MIQVDIFNSILNKDKILANYVFKKYKYAASKIIGNSRLRVHILDLIDFHDKEKTKFLELKKAILLRNQIILFEIKKLSELLGNYDIQYVFIKGASSLMHFDSIRSTRETSDIDILVNHRDLRKLHNLFKENNVQHVFDHRYNYSNSKLNHSLDTIKLDSGIYLDIHFRASSPLDFRDCPFTNKFMRDCDIKNYLGTEIRIIKKDYLYFHSIYQLLVRKEVNKHSSSIIDVISYYQEENRSSDYKNHAFLDSKKLFLAFNEWSSIKKDLSINNFKHNYFFVNLFKKPKYNLFRKIKILYLNLRYLNECVSEKYGYEATQKNLYFKFLIDKLKKLSNV